MFARAIQDDELLTCLDIDPGHMGDEIVGRRRTIAAYRQLLHSPSFCSAACEADPPIKGHRIVGFGCSVFVTSTFADDELARPRPGLNARIIASVAEGNPVVLDRTGLAHANANAGLDVAVLYPSWLKGHLDRSQVDEVQTRLAFNFLELHAGYRNRRMMIELIGDAEMEWARATQAWRQFAVFGDRSLVILTPDEAHSVPGLVASMLFHFREPQLRLHDVDQRLLLAALGDLTDEELAQRLTLNVSTVKKRWLAIFERISDTRPDLLAGADNDGDGRTRGKQKRHRVLAYMREHPEELRPYQHATTPPATAGKASAYTR
jgi:hypothetical protein